MYCSCQQQQPQQQGGFKTDKLLWPLLMSNGLGRDSYAKGSSKGALANNHLWHLVVLEIVTTTKTGSVGDSSSKRGKCTKDYILNSLLLNTIPGIDPYVSNIYTTLEALNCSQKAGGKKRSRSSKSRSRSRSSGKRSSRKGRSRSPKKK
ncbi:UNVERIFIED_CONTAM: hypothetical protein HDU68_000184 [Siphonaria sp. JEL0065]|nr:hypothetical protein HDU68_000184 [Siphonaria sp. JEL0065]